jgi:23S rRNA (uracil1939-C5)-methyltransferase
VKNRFILLENLLLEGMHPGGRAYGFHTGKKIYVNSGIPGEIADVKVRKKQTGFIVGNVTGIKSSSGKRTMPFCIHAGLCGGCNWQHINYNDQLILKKQILTEALNKYNIKAPEIPDVLPSDEKKFFRNKLEYTFSDTRWFYDWEGKVTCTSERTALGFHPADKSTKVVDIRECWLQKYPSRRVCDVVRQYCSDKKPGFYNFRKKSGLLRSLIIRTTTTGETMVIFGFMYDEPEIRDGLSETLLKEVPEISSLHFFIYSNPKNNINDEDLHIISGKSYIFEKSGGLKFRISPKSFYQPNPSQAEKIFRLATGFASPFGTGTVYDLYCGAGTISCHLALQSAKVIGIEGLRDATDDACENAKLNNLNNVQFIQGDVLKTFNSDFISKHGKPDVILLDPPRSGTLTEIKRTITESSPERIVYISCNPVSLAFDLKQLTEKYCISVIQPVDMLPHTHQLETVVLLTRQQ